MINGQTEIIAHIGYPTHTFKSPLIYNPYFESANIPAVVVPMACRSNHLTGFLPAIFGLDNVRGALITMPHKVAVVDLLDEVSLTVRMAGACNAVKKTVDGRLIGDLFDGMGFVRGLRRKGFDFLGKSALVIGTGGVGSAIAASLASTGLARMGLFDVHAPSAWALADRLRNHVHQLKVEVHEADPTGYDLVINATPLGMNPGDPHPFDLSRLSASTWVAEVVMSAVPTPLMKQARLLGAPLLVGTDMLFEQIPAYLEFFDLPTTTASHLRQVACLQDLAGSEA